jgi:transcriptional regulator with XRE-family HTH domain
MSEFMTPAWYVSNMLQREGVLQKDAAKRMGISSAYLSDMINGRRRIGPEMVALLIEHIETQDKDAARRDLHLLGAAADGWIIATPDGWQVPHPSSARTFLHGEGDE